MTAFLRPLLILLAITVLVPGGRGAELPAGEDSLRFNVFLEGKKVGWHEYGFSRRDGVLVVSSEVRFDVKFLFFKAYSYRHEAEEKWSDGCLVAIDATTNANGKRSQVDGERENGEFVVRTDDEKRRLPACVMTFAYWRPAFLDEPRLLNPQTGAYLDVDVETLPQASTRIGDSERQADRYRITAKDTDITVFYSPEDEDWLALESIVKGGRILRYERTET